MDLIIDVLLAVVANVLASAVAGSLAMAVTLDRAVAGQAVVVTASVVGIVFVAAHAWAWFKSRV